MKVDCPGCGTVYRTDLLFPSKADRPVAGKTFTVVCSVCEQQFDGRIATGGRWFGFGPHRSRVVTHRRR